MMTPQINRAYSSQSGTLDALYDYNSEKGKYKLTSLTFSCDGNVTPIALSKLWVNGFPAAALKGFNSSVMPEAKAQLIVEGKGCQNKKRMQKQHALNAIKALRMASPTAPFGIVPTLS